ncbi:hypothetical protein B0F90DRAFT_1789308 [Multifurca ochricompacta]|uniref:Uncharacterized protein n=1 Tax=Multifurca ochricompacta TaxID=376703 RepID=A0AAD4LWI5_9AGAM|nr:hypothetical protein B0F90DRAFT_1789308 [Multifurca ochricompacta]
MIFTDDHIITIQVTIAPEYSVKSKGLLQIADSLAKGFRQSRKWCHVFVTDRAENAESLLRKWTKKDVKIKEYDIFISIYSAVLDGKDFCQIKDEESGKKNDQVMKDIEIFEEDETAEVVEEAENSEMDED